MRKLTMAALVVCLVFAGAPAAFAEHTGGGSWSFPKKWPGAVSRNWCIETDFQDALTNSEYTNAKQSMTYQINNVWEDDTQLTTNFDLVGQIECSNDYNAPFWLCNSLPEGITSRVSYDPEPVGDIAVTKKCDTDGNGNIDFFWINICPQSACSLDWHWAHDTSVPNGDYQFSGVFTHEFGHALGFTGHWSPDSAACPNNSTQQTMCDGFDWLPAVRGSATSCGCHLASLGTQHDIPAFNAVYP